MRPPQESPTRHAVSSATPNSSMRGAPVAITSEASSTTAPSTQPPDTEPRKLPSPSMTRWEPAGRGAEPQVSTTVAIATSRPSSRHASAAPRTSSSRVSMPNAFLVCSPSLGENGPAAAGPQGRWPPASGGALAQPRLRVARTVRAARKRLAQIRHAREIVDRAEVVDMRQHRPHALRLGREAVESEQRVHPDHLAARLAQPLHFRPQAMQAVAFEPIGEDEHDRALAEHAPRPVAVELRDRLADARASRPVGGKRRAARERVVRSEEHTSELQSPLNLVCRL